MEKKYYWGLFFLFVQALVILRNSLDGYNYYFWFCDFAPIVFSIAFFIGNKNIIKGIINFGLIPQIIFLFDLIYTIINGTSLLGVHPSLLQFFSFSVLSTIFIHLTTIFALMITIKTKPTKKTVFYSIIFMFLVYLVTLIFTPSSEGINFVYSTGDLLKSYNFLIPNIIFLWPFLTFLFLILPAKV